LPARPVVGSTADVKLSVPFWRGRNADGGTIVWRSWPPDENW
jgi:hypothetical protein